MLKVAFFVVVVVVLLQVHFTNHSSAAVLGFLNFVLMVGELGFGSFNSTRLPILMPMGHRLWHI